MILQKVQQIYTTQMLEQILEQHYVLGAPNFALNDVNNATPTDGQVLTWDGAGNFTFTTVSGGGSSYGDSDVETYLNMIFI